MILTETVLCSSKSVCVRNTESDCSSRVKALLAVRQHAVSTHCSRLGQPQTAPEAKNRQFRAGRRVYALCTAECSGEHLKL